MRAMRRSEAEHDAGRAQGLASDPGASAFVAANAGAGKTHVLVNRVIRLMLKGAEPDRILCLTFTRAAAAEMARRLFEDLSKWIALEDKALEDKISTLAGYVPFEGSLHDARRLFARALETPGGLKIQTIHAFCERLLQRFPVEAGVAPGFKVLEESEAAELLAEARRETLLGAGAEATLALGRVVAFAGEDALDGLIRALLAKRAELKGLGAGGSRPSFAERLCAILGIDADETVDSIAADAIAGMGEMACERAAEVLRMRTGKTDPELAGALGSALAARSPVLRFDRLKSAFLTAKGKRKAEGSILTKKAQADHPELVEPLLALADRVAELADRERAVEVRDATLALIALGAAILDRYEVKKLSLGRYDYDDLILRARGLFSDQAGGDWVLYRLDGGIDHILIDEAQDTSRGQWEIVRSIASEFFAGEGQRPEVKRTLFAVGDRKQSIFSFQGADPDAFEEMEAWFAERARGADLRFLSVPLEVSFRSTQILLDAVDAVFAAPLAAQGVLPANAAPLKHRAARLGVPGLIEIWPPVPRVKADPASAWDPRARAEVRQKPRVILAERIAGLIRGWMETGETLPSGEPIRAGDVLILLRHRTTFMDTLVKALKRQGVPVAGVDRLELGRHIAVKDLLSLVRFVSLPDDDLSLAELLKSPLIARDDGEPLSDDDLLGFAPERGRALWRALRDAAAAGAPYAEAVERLSAWLRRAHAEPPFEFLGGVLARDGGRRRLLARLGPEAAEPVDALLTLALEHETAGADSLRAFLALVEEEGGDIKRETEQSGNAVRIMTVHGAKGLEAPIVILPDTCDPPSGREDDKVLLAQDGLGPLPIWRLRADVEPGCVEQLRKAQREKARQEYNRLLYVAMTRARDRLYVCGALPAEEAKEECWHSLISDALKSRAHELRSPDGAVAAWRIGGDPLLQASVTPPQTPLHRGDGSRPLAGLRYPPSTRHAAGEGDRAQHGGGGMAASPPGWALQPAPDEAAMRPLAPSRLARPEHEAISSPFASDDARRFRRGHLIHRLLQTLPDVETASRLAAARAFLARAAADLGEPEREALVAEAMAIVTLPGLETLFGPASLAEAPIAAAIDGLRIAGQVDRLAVTPEEVLIADYKTNRPPPLTLADVDPAYVRQLAAYRIALGLLYPGRAVRCVLVWTDGPCLMELPASLLETVRLDR